MKIISPDWSRFGATLTPSAAVAGALSPIADPVNAIGRTDEFGHEIDAAYSQPRPGTTNRGEYWDPEPAEMPAAFLDRPHLNRYASRDLLAKMIAAMSGAASARVGRYIDIAL